MKKKENLNELMFRIRASRLRKKPRTKYYWQIVKERIQLIQGVLKSK